MQYSLPCDPGFQPFCPVLRSMIGLEAVTFTLHSGEGVSTSHRSGVDFCSDESRRIMERLAKFLLWSRGGWKLEVRGPDWVQAHLREVFSHSGARAFDVGLMEQIYGRPFEVVGDAGSSPSRTSNTGKQLGGHLDGCRIGFDLGASDYKIAATLNGEVVFADEFPWNPKVEADPDYHWDHLNQGLRLAAEKLPRLDAIGGSSAGVIVNNQIKVASLFRSVPKELFDEKVVSIFQRLQSEWKVPVEVANDGDVTALAGAMSLGVKGILGIAMGSSEAAGYIDPSGRITGWLNELAFCPVDENPDAAVDEWSGDSGVGALYFSQQAVNKLLNAAGIELPPDMGLPQRLVEVQALMSADDGRAERIYKTIGGYLGHTIPLYSRFYDFEHLLLLGRVTSGKGGVIVVEKAQTLLRTIYPEVAERVTIHVPDEHSRRVGQAVAAASLPEIQA